MHSGDVISTAVGRNEILSLFKRGRAFLSLKYENLSEGKKGNRRNTSLTSSVGPKKDPLAIALCDIRIPEEAINIFMIR